MARRATVDVDVVGIDTDYEGMDSCCIETLYGELPAVNGEVVICDVCGDAWSSQLKDADGFIWLRTFAGSYSDAVRQKIKDAAKREKSIKKHIILCLSALVAFVIVWNIGDYWDEPNAVAKIVFSSSAIVLITGAASCFLFFGLFKRFSRNTRKIKFEINANSLLSD